MTIKQAIGIDTLRAFFNEEFPGNTLQIESIGNQQACVRQTPQKNDLRPGNTVSGPFMMSLIDASLYVTILGELGLVALAVTTNLNVTFLRKPAADKDIIAQCELLKVGRKLVVGEVTLRSDGDERPLAHAIGTYALPS